MNSHSHISAMIRALFILGTRPEAIKLAPVILHQKSRPDQFEVRVCVTGQHSDLVARVMRLFKISPDHDLNVMLPGQTLSECSARILMGLDNVVQSANPDLVVVQGDTTTTICGALAAFYRKIPVAHVEAGLRTGDSTQPFPEEMNRVLTTRLANMHFAPTESAKANLLREGCSDAAIKVTGNSGIDAVFQIRDRLACGELSGCTEIAIEPGKKLILVTAHRRENFGSGLENICAAAAEIAARPDVHLLFPVHPNPQVWNEAQRALRNLPNVTLVQSLEYVDFVDVMRKAHLILTDSGGIQEEALALGKPILLLRDKTERVEGVAAGAVKLVGCCKETIVSETRRLLDDARAYRSMARIQNVYGDGTASAQIADGILAYFDQEIAPPTSNSLQNLRRSIATWTQPLTAAAAVSAN